MANGAPRGYRNGKPTGPPPTGGAVDLGALKALTPEQEEMGEFHAELEAGMRCRGCGKRIAMGFRFSAFKAQVVEGQPTVVQTVKAACSREECGYASKVNAGASVVEAIEFAWLDEGGVEKPVPAKLREAEEARREKVREERAAAAAAGEKTSEGNATA